MGHRLRVFRGAELIKPGAAGKYIIYVEQGKAAITYTDPRGCPILISYMYAGDLIDESSVSVHLREVDICLRAVDVCIIRRIPEKDFWVRAQNHPELYSLVIHQVSGRLLNTTRRLMDITTLDVNQRIANILNDLSATPEAKSHPKGYLISTTRQNLASMAGCSRESAGRAVKKLQGIGFMEAKGKKMVVYTNGYERLRAHYLPDLIDE